MSAEPDAGWTSAAMAMRDLPVTLRPMTGRDLPLLHDWLNRPHIVEWWGGEAERPSLEEVLQDYRPEAMAEENVTLYIAMQGAVPIGFAQSYVALGSGDGWWVDETDPGVRGIDQSLADPRRLGQGLGSQLVRMLAATLFADPAVTAIQTDPSPDNHRAIRCYENAGFTRRGTVTTPDGPAVYMTQTRAAFDAACRARLVAAVRESAWFMPALRAVRGLGLPCWCIGAGAVRNLVWDRLHGHDVPSTLADVDVAYFDATDASPGRDAALQARLRQAVPDLPWEVTNQAAVHTWFEAHFGHPVDPLPSLEAAIASWPEFATCVGITLRPDDAIEVVAPHGLADLFSMTIRRNPARVSLATYRDRVAQKRYAERWPGVTVVHDGGPTPMQNVSTGRRTKHPETTTRMETSMDAPCLKPSTQAALEGWHRYLASNEAKDLAPLLAEEVVFRSPVAHTPYPGREAITLVLTTVNQVFENFRYHREFASDDGLNVVLEFSAEIDGKGLKGADFIRFDEAGKIVEFEVMVRPASGLEALKQAMGARLADRQATLKGG